MRVNRALNHCRSRELMANVPYGHLFQSDCRQNASNTRVTGEEQSYRPTYSGSTTADMPLAPPGSNKLRRPSHYTSQQTIGSMHWLFRTNVPRRRSSYYPADIRKRNFFGIGEIVSVITNPAETVRSLTESKRLLGEARQEINENRERSQIRPAHTFSRLPGFFARPAEVKAIEKTLEGEPAFTVLFGASSVGKTALLREVLCRDTYHVLHFDLRIAGFADLASLYMSLSRQMELYFEAISTQMEGYKEFEKEAWSFKHDRLNVERRISEVPPHSGINRIQTSDIARLMELFQSSLLKYWEYEPFKEHEEKRHEEEPKSHHPESNKPSSSKTGPNGRFRNLLHLRGKNVSPNSQQHPEKDKEESPKAPAKKMPVIFFDEAHKLPALIQSVDAMNSLLSAFLVLTKQDRLCHVIHATSDPFYHTWLRQLNVMQHCKIITIGDCSKAETRTFFREQMLPRVPEHLRYGLDFEVLYEALGGKLVHWHDFVTDYGELTFNSNGRLDVKQSSHFLQAHALLNLHIIHSSENQDSFPEAEGQEGTTTNLNLNSSQPRSSANKGRFRPSGFKIYSAINQPSKQDREDVMPFESDFTSAQLLRVMSRIAEPGTTYLPYFPLCRELGVHAVDAMIKGRILDLRWTDAVTKETEQEDASYLNRQSRPFSIEGAVSSGRTVVDNTNHNGVNAGAGSEEDIVPVSEREAYRGRDSRWSDGNVLEYVVGPKLVPMTPIMKYAMKEVLCDYEAMEEDHDTASEYASAASLSDVEEY